MISKNSNFNFIKNKFYFVLKKGKKRVIYSLFIGFVFLFCSVYFFFHSTIQIRWYQYLSNEKKHTIIMKDAIRKVQQVSDFKYNETKATVNNVKLIPSIIIADMQAQEWDKNSSFLYATRFAIKLLNSKEGLAFKWKTTEWAFYFADNEYDRILGVIIGENGVVDAGEILGVHDENKTWIRVKINDEFLTQISNKMPECEKDPFNLTLMDVRGKIIWMSINVDDPDPYHFRYYYARSAELVDINDKHEIAELLYAKRGPTFF